MSEGTEAAGAEAPAETTDVVATTPETPVTETAKEETAAEAETPEPAEETEDRPKRESGYSRMKRRALLAEAALANQRLRESAGVTQSETDKPPREEDFNGDWGKFIAASAAWEARQAVKSVLQDDRKVSQSDRAKQLNDEVMADFEERKEAFKAKVTDFDQVVEGFVNGGGKFSDVVRELVIDSDDGPALAYHLAKNPALANKLNALTPLQAAKEVARIEDALSKPSVKTTKAPPPAKPLNGGAGPSFDPRTGPDDMKAFASWLNKGLDSRRR